MALNYKIRREKHAIGEFTAKMQFASGVSAQTFAMVTHLLKEAASGLDLPAPLNIQVFNIAIGNPGAQPPFAAPASGYQRFSSDGEVACSLTCDYTSITFTLREYDRWHKVLPTIAETFSKIGSAYLADVPAIKIFSLQYINEFSAVNADVNVSAELFRKDSKWLSPFAYESDQPWHCHVGQFIPSDGPYRNLMNLNCDVAPTIKPGDDVSRNYVRVLILAACHYDLAGIGPLIVDAEGLRSAIETNFDNAHTLEKKILGEIISDEYLAVMGEGASEH